MFKLMCDVIYVIFGLFHQVQYKLTHQIRVTFKRNVSTSPKNLI